MINKLLRFLGISLGLLFILLGALFGITGEVSVSTVVSSILIGVVFIYFGLTNRSVLKDIFEFLSRN